MKNILGVKPGNFSFIKPHRSHRSVKKEGPTKQMSDSNIWATLYSQLLQTTLFKRYPYKGEGFLTEMRSKMVNRQQLNDVALKMGFKS